MQITAVAWKTSQTKAMDNWEMRGLFDVGGIAVTALSFWCHDLPVGRPTVGQRQDRKNCLHHPAFIRAVRFPGSQPCNPWCAWLCLDETKSESIARVQRQGLLRHRFKILLVFMKSKVVNPPSVRDRKHHSSFRCYHLSMDSSDEISADTLFYIHTVAGHRFGPGNLATLEQWALEQRIPRDATLIAVDDHDGTQPINVQSILRLARIINAPPIVAMPRTSSANTSPNAPAIVPYSNQPALAGYYVGVFALIPGIGIVLGIVAIWLGIKGIRKWQAEPQSKGLGHAIVAIFLGIVGPALWFLVFWWMSSQW